MRNPSTLASLTKASKTGEILVLVLLYPSTCVELSFSTSPRIFLPDSQNVVPNHCNLQTRNPRFVHKNDMKSENHIETLCRSSFGT